MAPTAHAVLTALLTLLAVVTSGTTSAPAQAATSASPLIGAKLWADPQSPARTQADAWRADRPRDAAAMDRLARTPQATWLGSWSGNVRTATDALLTRAGTQVPVLVLYNIPGRDCSGGYSGGGARTPAGYRAWVRNIVAGIGARRAAVIIEPDALADLECLAPKRRAERFAMLRFAVTALSARPRTAVYLDAGHSGWMPVPTAATNLRAAGVARADGFALNVSNYRTTATEVRHGRAVLASLGRPRGMGFVIDTSRNGNGPAPGAAWCNPPGRAIGAAPRTSANANGLHALLWVKRPGESDGTCAGGPTAGEWWPARALQLVRAAG